MKGERDGGEGVVCDHYPCGILSLSLKQAHTPSKKKEIKTTFYFSLVESAQVHRMPLVFSYISFFLILKGEQNIEMF